MGNYIGGNVLLTMVQKVGRMIYFIENLFNLGINS